MRIDDGLLRKLNTFFIRLPANLGARVYRATDQTHDDTGGWVDLSFSNERWDSGGCPSYPNGIWAAGSPTRLVAVKTGWWSIWGGVRFAAGAGSRRILRITVDVGQTIIAVHEHNTSAQTPPNLTISTLYWLHAGQYVELGAYQDSGGNLDMLSVANLSPEFAIVRIP